MNLSGIFTVSTIESLAIWIKERAVAADSALQNLMREHLRTSHPSLLSYPNFPAGDTFQAPISTVAARWEEQSKWLLSCIHNTHDGLLGYILPPARTWREDFTQIIIVKHDWIDEEIDAYSKEGVLPVDFLCNPDLLRRTSVRIRHFERPRQPCATESKAQPVRSTYISGLDTRAPRGETFFVLCSEAVAKEDRLPGRDKLLPVLCLPLLLLGDTSGARFHSLAGSVMPGVGRREILKLGVQPLRYQTTFSILLNYFKSLLDGEGDEIIRFKNTQSTRENKPFKKSELRTTVNQVLQD